MYSVYTHTHTRGLLNLSRLPLFPAFLIFFCLKIFSKVENVTYAYSVFHLNPSNSFPLSPVPVHFCCRFLCLLTSVWTGNRGQLYIQPGVFKLEIYFPATRLLCLLRQQLSHYLFSHSQSTIPPSFILESLQSFNTIRSSRVS